MHSDQGGIVGIGRVQRAVHMDRLSASSQKNMSSRRDSWKKEGGCRDDHDGQQSPVNPVPAVSPVHMRQDSAHLNLVHFIRLTCTHSDLHLVGCSLRHTPPIAVMLDFNSRLSMPGKMNCLNKSIQCLYHAFRF